MAIAMVVLAGAFGVTAAIIVLTRPPQQQPVVINMPSAQPPPLAPVDTNVPPPDPVAPTDSASPASTKPAVAVRGGPKPQPGAQGASAPAPTNSAIAALLNNGTGPSGTGPSPGGSSGGGQLSSDQIQRVVHNYQVGVRRSCFDRLATDKTGTVQVTVDMTVNGSGQVTSSSADGNEPSIAKCIEGAVRNWQFPATGDTSKIRIPFKFVKQ
jgi:hypothetical protein